MSSEIDY